MEKKRPEELSDDNIVRVVARLSFNMGKNSRNNEVDVLTSGNIKVLVREYKRRFPDSIGRHAVLIRLIKSSRSLGAKVAEPNIDILNPSSRLQRLIEEALDEMDSHDISPNRDKKKYTALAVSIVALLWLLLFLIYNVPELEAIKTSIAIFVLWMMAVGGVCYLPVALRDIWLE